MKSHLYPPAQQLTGQDLEGGAAFAGETSQPAEETCRTGVPDHVTGMEHIQHLKVIVDGVADNHFALKYTKDLQERGRGQILFHQALLTTDLECGFKPL